MYINMTGGKIVTAVNTLNVGDRVKIGEFETAPTDKTFYEITLIANSTIDESITIRETGLVENVDGTVQYNVDRFVENRTATILDADLETFVNGQMIEFYVNANTYNAKLNWFLALDRYTTKSLA